MTLWEAFAVTAGSQPARPAIVADDGTLTAAELAAESVSMSGRLSDAGVRPGRRVLIMVPNSARYAAALFAVARAGAVAVPLDPGLSRRELARIADVTAPGVVVGGTERAVATITDTLLKAGKAGKDVQVVDYSRLLRASASGRAGGRAGVVPDVAQVEPRDAAVMFFTSGTTGAPKGVVHSHRGLLASFVALQRLHAEFFEGTPLAKLRRVAVVARRYGTRLVAAAGRQTWLTPIPYHAIGGHEVLIGAVLGGHRLVAMETFHPRRIAEALERERVNVFPATPAMAESILALPDLRRFDLSALLVVGLGGAPASPDLVRRAQEGFGCSVTVGYGATELGGGVLVTRIEDPDDVKRETVGRPFPGVEVRVLNEDGAEVPAGQVGELACRSETVMSGYAVSPGDPAKPGPVSDGDDGWHRTGDLGVRAEDGNVRIVGRRDDMIIRAGYKIQPAEIEEVLDALAGVRQSVVIGVPAPKVGQQVWAFAVPEPGAVSVDRQALLAHCRANLSAHKVPDHLRICESLPVNSLGKVQRYRLAEMALEESRRGQDEDLREAR